MNSQLDIIKYQLGQIRKGGISIAVRKLKMVVLAVLVIPVILIMRTVRPFIEIRMHKLDGGRIGSLILADWYLSIRNTCNERRKIDIFYFACVNSVLANRQLQKMWKRVLTVFPFWVFAEKAYYINKMVPGFESHIIPVPCTDDLVFNKNNQLELILGNKAPHISFTPEEETRGENALHDLGVPRGALFICFHARDASYLKETSPNINFSYHDYRDSDIQNYVSAAEWMASRDYYSIRLGHVVEKKLEVDNPAIIDYSTNGKRSDFSDVYLVAKCKFLICSDTGLGQLGEMLRKPTVYVNWTPIRRVSPWVLTGIFIFKKFYLRSEKRFLTFREILDSELGNVRESKVIEEHGIELMENTSDEIRDVAIEMEERLNGTWKEEKEDEDLQKRFWNLYGPDKLKSPDLRIGAEYLRQNHELLH